MFPLEVSVTACAIQEVNSVNYTMDWRFRDTNNNNGPSQLTIETQSGVYAKLQAMQSYDSYVPDAQT